MSTSTIPIPRPILALFSKFPLHTHPPILTNSQQNIDSSSLATLWIQPPKPDIFLPSTNLLSEDVECLKWQAYIALRLSHRGSTISKENARTVAVRWDIAEDGGVDGRLPALQANDRKLLAARAIPGWVDKILGEEGSASPLEGYADERARDESRAWVALLEGVVHAALVRPWASAELNLSNADPCFTESFQASVPDLHLIPIPWPRRTLPALSQNYANTSSRSVVRTYKSASAFRRRACLNHCDPNTVPRCNQIIK